MLALRQEIHKGELYTETEFILYTFDRRQQRIDFRTQTTTVFTKAKKIINK